MIIFTLCPFCHIELSPLEFNKERSNVVKCNNPICTSGFYHDQESSNFIFLIDDLHILFSKNKVVIFERTSRDPLFEFPYKEEYFSDFPHLTSLKQKIQTFLPFI